MEAASVPAAAGALRASAPLSSSGPRSSGSCSAASLARYCCVQTPTGRSTTSRTGLSNGMIWALIALGYTLVYGIIELINFAHGEVFMIGSFVVGLAVRDARRDRGAGRRRAIVGLLLVLAIVDGRLRHAQRDDRARGLPAAARRAEAGAADHRDRHVVHPPERRPAVAPDAGLAARPDPLAERGLRRSSASTSCAPTSSRSSSRSRC